ncbi:MAG: ABC transporter ATP-binding protein [Kiritimatiellae bacterium]|nr:ABC transporter ATP-binding protein [Kiritimatiellia bacterium]
MESLKAVGVWRKYGAQEVLKGLDLSLGAGAFEALMGPSGCGKSTFLHLASGLLSADAGAIEVGGTDITKLGDTAATKFRRRHIGVVFQAFNLLNEKTVEQNILLPLALDGARLGAADVRSRVDNLMAELGVAGLAKKRPEQLSGGEQQRVAIARALVAKPDVVLADEPTGNLDAAAARDICAVLGSVSRIGGSAVLVVTHDPQVAACAERVHFLRDGRIAASAETHGDPARVSQLYLETYR